MSVRDHRRDQAIELLNELKGIGKLAELTINEVTESEVGANDRATSEMIRHLLAVRHRASDTLSDLVEIMTEVPYSSLEFVAIAAEFGSQIVGQNETDANQTYEDFVARVLDGEK